MSEPNSNGFRMSDGFIECWTRVLVVSVVAVPVLGIALGFASDGDWAPSWEERRSRAAADSSGRS